MRDLAPFPLYISSFFLISFFEFFVGSSARTHHPHALLLVISFRGCLLDSYILLCDDIMRPFFSGLPSPPLMYFLLCS